MPTMCKSKLRTLLFFFVHFIYLSLAVYFLFLFFFYLSPLKVCHHARCSFSVGSTCKVVGFFLLVEVFHTSDDWRGGTTGRISSGQTLTTLESKPPPTIKNRNKEKKDPNTDAAAGFVRSVVVVGGASIIIEDSQWVKQKQFSSCCDSCHPIHKRGRFYIMTSSVDIFSADKRRTKL